MQLLIALAIMVAVGVPVLVAAVAHRMRDAQSGHDSSMTVAMSVGMMAGLTLGIVAGLLVPADLWPPTAVGVVAGIAAGAAAGAPAGLMAVLEGAMSGVMGGAMGAMMGGMMPDHGAWLTGSAAVLTAATGAAIMRLLTTGHHMGHHEMIMVPLRIYSITGAVVAAVGIAGWMAAGPLVHRLPLPAEHQHVAPLDVKVTAKEFTFAPAVIEVPVGKPVRLQFVNQGGQEHDLTVPGLEYRLAASRDRRAEPPGLHVYAAAGDTETLEFIPLRTGEFKAYCSVAGHKEQGMALSVRVVDSE